jgi:hypothetical protein
MPGSQRLNAGAVPMKMRLPLFALLALAGLARPSQALVINFTQIAGDTLTTQQLAAFDAAAQAWESVLTDPVTVNISIGFRDLGTASNGGYILGGATPSETSISYGTFKSLLTADAKSAVDVQAVASLPLSTPSNTIYLTTANAKALGVAISPGVTDATIEFTSNSAITYQYSRNADGTVNAGSYDFLGVAEHEIAHALGFISDAGVASVDTPLDLFRFSSAGTRILADGSACFSLDDGATCIAQFSDGYTYQTSHWAPGTDALMAPALASGQTENINPQIDIPALDAIGWDVTVPEPGSLPVLAMALGILPLIRRRQA